MMPGLLRNWLMSTPQKMLRGLLCGSQPTFFTSKDSLRTVHRGSLLMPAFPFLPLLPLPRLLTDRADTLAAAAAPVAAAVAAAAADFAGRGRIQLVSVPFPTIFWSSSIGVPLDTAVSLIFFDSLSIDLCTRVDCHSHGHEHTYIHVRVDRRYV